MKKLFQLLTIFLISVLYGQNEFTSKLKVTVVKVYDGDTFTVKDKNNLVYKIRLGLIDAPELSQEFGVQSRNQLNHLVINKSVNLKCLEKPDMYGRYVCLVFLKTVNINEKMIKTGYAWYYPEYDNDLKSRIKLNTLQIKADKKNLGLWIGIIPEEPWLYRKSKRN